MIRASKREPDDELALGEVRHFSLSSRFLLQGDSRFDSTAYQAEGFAKLSSLERSGLLLRPLSERVSRVYHPTENQPRSNFKRIWVARGEGPPFLTGKQLTFFRPDKEKFLSRKVPKLAEMTMAPGTILLSRSGVTGVPVLVGEWLSQFAITDDALRVFGGEAPIGYIYAYLASSYGRALMVRNEYGATVPHLEAKHALAVPVPSLSPTEEEEFHNRIIRAYALRDRANAMLDQAERDLYTLLGVEPFGDDDMEYLGGKRDPRAFAVSSQLIENRFDATFYLPTQTSATRKLAKGKYPLVDLHEVVEWIDVAPRFARVYVDRDHGTPLLQGSHLPQMFPQRLKYISNSITRNLERWIIPDGLVLVTCSGTIGRVAVSTTLQRGWAASQHILRIHPRQGEAHPGFLALFLACPFGQHQIRAKVYGGVVHELTAADMGVLKVPRVPGAEQDELGRTVRDAYELRDQAAAEERATIEDLERRIEQPGPKEAGRLTLV